MSVQTIMYKVGDQVKLTETFVRTTRKITFEKDFTACIDVILTNDPEADYVVSVYIPSVKRYRQCKVRAAEIAPLDEPKDAPDQKPIPSTWKPIAEHVKQIVEKTAEIEQSAPDTAQNDQKSTENGTNGDYKKAKGVLPDEPSEDLIRQSRDGAGPDIDQQALMKQNELLVARIKQLEAQVDDLVDAVLLNSPNPHRNAVIDTVPRLEHLLLPNTHAAQLNEMVGKGWQIVSVQWIAVNNPAQKIPLPCACAHLTRPIVESKTIDDAESETTVALAAPVNSRIVQDLQQMTPTELVAMTAGMPASYRSQMMNAQIKYRALAHVGR